MSTDADRGATKRRLMAIGTEVARYRTKAAATTHRDPAVSRALADCETAIDLAIEALNSVPWPQEQP